MTIGLTAGAVVEIRVGRCVFVGVIVGTGQNQVRLEMDGRLKTGTPVSLVDPEAECSVRGKVAECTPGEAGGFRVVVSETAPHDDDGLLFAWPLNALQFASL